MPRTRTQRARIAVLALLGLAGLAAHAAPDEPESPAPATSPDAELSGRLRRLEDLNRELLNRYESVLEREAERDRRYRDLEAKYNSLLDRLDHEPPEPGPITGQAPGPPVDPGLAPVATPEPGPGPTSDRRRGDRPEVPLPGPGRDYPDFARGEGVPLGGVFDEGFRLVSPDDEFTLGFRVLNQVDSKTYTPADTNPALSGLYLPRTRFYFEGNLTRTFYYEVSVQRSVEGEFDLLDAYLNTYLSEGFQIKVGRSLVPYSYDWYDHLEPYFITPERSLVPLNFGLSRQAGVSAWGYLGDGRLEYAVGGYGGGLQGLADENNTRDAVGYLNARPFLFSERYPALRFLNLGGSAALGQSVRVEDTPLLPLRTSIQTTENGEAAQQASISFLDFEENVRALGGRLQGALHAAFYGGGWSVEAEVQAARYQFIRFGRPEPPVQPHVPIFGYHLTAARFLTGEKPTGRTTIVPMRPFDPIHHRFGPGAIEPFARISHIRLGEEVFRFDLADRDDWTNNTYLTDVGFNWYPNRFIKIYFDWQHAMFGSPVLINARTGLHRRSNDLLWVRMQVWF